MSVVAARFLGPEDMGRQSFIAFISLSATSLFGGGIASTLMRYVGEMLGGGRPRVARDLASWAWGIAGIAAAIGTAAMVGTGLLGATPEAAWILAGIGCGLGILQSIPNAVLVGAQEWRRASMVGLDHRHDRGAAGDRRARRGRRHRRHVRGRRRGHRAPT